MNLHFVFGINSVILHGPQITALFHILLQTEDKSVMYTRLEGSLFASHHDIHRDMSYSYCLNWHFHQLLT
jgi:hypothetical protein